VESAESAYPISHNFKASAQTASLFGANPMKTNERWNSVYQYMNFIAGNGKDHDFTHNTLAIAWVRGILHDLRRIPVA
jgi:hypothetical protein